MNALIEIYRLIRSFPKDEILGLTSQIRRAAQSVPSNIAEGYKRRRYPNDYLRALTYAEGSQGETLTDIEVAVRLNYLEKAEGRRLWKLYDEIGAMLDGLCKSVEKKAQNRPKKQG
ncbi:MAG: four helix bundle protein [Planctomycetes bacterium]|nr:four helix bundle protein [Planctomycetota bacterium]